MALVVRATLMAGARMVAVGEAMERSLWGVLGRAAALAAALAVGAVGVATGVSQGPVGPVAAPTVVSVEVAKGGAVMVAALMGRGRQLCWRVERKR